MDLYERLKRIKASRSSPLSQAPAAPAVPPVPASEQSSPPAPIPSSVDPQTDEESCAWELMAEYVWRRRRIIHIEAPQAPPSTRFFASGQFPYGEQPSWDQMLYFDSETTGLSSGAGTLVFLFGIGRFVGQGDFEIIQWFLGDFPGEPLFLRAILDEISPGDRPAPIMVSYNGRSFDNPLFTTRLLMNGMQPLENVQLDLLYPARRLYSTSLENCRLGSIERHILGISRDIDIPGSEIPDRYFEFQRAMAEQPPDADPAMIPVLEHHASDIGSLAVFQIHLHKILSGLPGLPSGEAMPAPSVRGLARQLLVSLDEQSAIDLLQSQSREAADFYLLAVLLRRHRSYEGAHQIWSRLYREFGDFRGLEAMLVHLEHRVRDYQQCAELIEEYLSGHEPTLKTMQPSLIEDLQRRKERVLKKIAKSG